MPPFLGTDVKFRNHLLIVALTIFHEVAFAASTLEVGDQRGNARAVMEAAGVLSGLPYTVERHEFANAAPVLESLNSGHLDAGLVGDDPLTFAAAAGVGVKAIFASEYNGNAIIVKPGSAIQSVQDLKGKKVVTVKGAADHAFLLQSLQQAGVSPDAVKLIFTTPAEAILLLDNGSTDAVSTWEPFVSFATTQHTATIVADGKDHPSLNYLVASNDAIEHKRAELTDFRVRLAKARQWGVDNPKPYAAAISKLLRVPEEVALGKVQREGNAPIEDSARIQTMQEQTIKLYSEAGLIPKVFSANSVLDSSFGSKQVTASAGSVSQ